jgi:tetratricopeptide (TPR) repeat protein
MLVALEFLGDYHMERGELELAESHYRDGLRAAAVVAPRSDHVAEISRRMGELELARGNSTGALVFLQEALRVAGEINDKREEAIIHRVLGEVHAARADRERAKARLGDAVTRMRRLGERFELGKALLATGMILAESPGDDSCDGPRDVEQRYARSFLREAREIFQTLGVRYLAARANVELSRWENRWGSPEGESSSRAAAEEALRPAGENRPSLRESVAALERNRILEVMHEFGGNQTRVASALGLTRKGLASKMRRYGLKAGSESG